MSAEASPVIANLGTIPSDAERARLPDLLEQERLWYADESTFYDDDAVNAAVVAGTLEEVQTTQFVRPVNRFYDNPYPRQTGTFSVLTPRAISNLEEIGQRWSDLLSKSGVNASRIRLAVSSMTRTQLYQDDIVKKGLLTVPDSTHRTGNTVDIDRSGYYLQIENGSFVPIIHPRRHLGTPLWDYYADLRRQHGRYDARLTHAAHRVADLMHRRKAINLAPEFLGTPNACLHIARRPEITA